MKNYVGKFKAYEPMTIVCVGDSTTSQEWCHPNWFDWLNFTFRQCGDWEKGWLRKLINSGRDGGTIHDYLENFEREIARFNPDVVILSLGFNHIELVDHPETLSQLLQKLLLKIKGLKADLITWSTYDTPHLLYSKKLADISELYRSVTKEFDGVFVDVYHEFQRYDLERLFTYVQEDGNDVWGIKPGGRDFLHCNVIGNQIIAEKIVQEAFNLELTEWPGLGTMKLINLRKYLKAT